MTLGERLKQRRNELDLSQPALAERMGIEQSFLSKLENDRSLPSNDTFRGWIAALNLSLAETLEPLEMSYIHSKLRPIADIEQYVSKNSARQLKERQRLFRVSAIALALAFPLFYSGFTALGTFSQAKRPQYIDRSTAYCKASASPSLCLGYSGSGANVSSTCEDSHCCNGVRNGCKSINIPKCGRCGTVIS